MNLGDILKDPALKPRLAFLARIYHASRCPFERSPVRKLLRRLGAL